MATKEMVGKTFGQLTVTHYSHTARGTRWWVCKCSCGGEKVASGAELRRKRHPLVSCGCYRPTKTHGHSVGGRRTATYKAYDSMRDRCLNPNNHAYHRYGGRGITICDRWLDAFEMFYADMGDRPTGMSLDRIDNDGPYSPENCRWATFKVQQNNRSTNLRLTVEGVSMTVSEVAAKFELSKHCVRYRLLAGWPVERIINTPLKGFDHG